MPARYKSPLNWSDVTPRADFVNRRQLIAGAAALGLGGPAFAKIAAAPSKYSTDAVPNTLEEITQYNNFYEFGTRKEEPAINAQKLTTDPWAIEIGGLVERPGTYDLADVIAGQGTGGTHLPVPLRRGLVDGGALDRLRAGGDCWRKVGVQPGAKYVAFETLMRPEEMPGSDTAMLEWPYREGLRLDEAMHPLTILATGLYGEPMPKQNGAPIRLVVPWKYGFKSIKSIVRIDLLTEPAQDHLEHDEPAKSTASYANVNPEVDHPRWSQASERRIGAGLFAGRQRYLDVQRLWRSRSPRFMPGRIWQGITEAAIDSMPSTLCRAPRPGLGGLYRRADLADLAVLSGGERASSASIRSRRSNTRWASAACS